MLTPKRRSARGSAALGALGAVAFLILGSFVLLPVSHGRKPVKDIGGASSPKPATELAFLNPGRPGSLSESSTLRLAFRVHNVEGGVRTYRWTVTTNAPGRARIIAASGRLSLADGASHAVHLSIPVSCTAPRSRITVSVGGARQTIGFWASCPSHGALPTAPSTELTFINPAKPGTQQTNGDVQFAFKVDNHSGSSQRYRYTVTIQATGRAPVEAAVGSFSLATAHYGVVHLDVPVVCTGAPSRMIVSLGNAQPAIGFWLSCT